MGHVLRIRRILWTGKHVCRFVHIYIVDEAFSYKASPLQKKVGACCKRERFKSIEKKKGACYVYITIAIDHRLDLVFRQDPFFWLGRIFRELETFASV